MNPAEPTAGRVLTAWRIRRDPDVVSTIERAPVLPGTGATKGAPAPALPYVVRPTATARARWALLAVAGVVGAPALTWFLGPEHWPQILVVALSAAQAAAAGTAGATRRLVAEHSGLQLRSYVGDLRVPWSQVAGFRWDGDTVLLADVDGGLEQFGPVPRAGAAAPGAGEPGAAAVAAALTAIQDRGLAAGTTDEPTRRRLGPSALAAGVAVATQLAVVVFWLAT